MQLLKMAVNRGFWREATTLILVGKAPKRPPQTAITSSDASHQDENNMLAKLYQQYDYKILMVKRSTKSRFMPGVHVFPGGQIDGADFSSEWLDLFSRFGHSLDDIKKRIHIQGPRPPLLQHEKGPLPIDLGLRIGAIRETFEETGVLLVKGNGIEQSSDLSKTIAEWRTKVHKDPANFISMCKEYDIVPNIWNLFEWSNWLTPVGLKQAIKEPPPRPKRFDTMFYICFVDSLLEADHDRQETTQSGWYSPAEALVPSPRDPVELSGPTIYEFRRIFSFNSLSDLEKYSRERECLGLERWMSHYIACKDGVVGINQGDDMYPENPDYEGTRDPVYTEDTVEELRNKCTSLNRHEHMFGDGNPMSDRSYQLNIDLACGQAKPVLDIPKHLSSGKL